MSEIEKDENLFKEFPPISTQEWEEKIKADLKGADYERTLIWRTNEGFNVRPYYRQEDLKEVEYLNVLPTEFPYVRGEKQEKNSWFIRQEIEVTDFAEANAKAVGLLSLGITSFGFVIDCGKEFSKADMQTLLKGLPLDTHEFNFSAGEASIDVAKAFAEYAKANNALQVKGSITFDQVMRMAKNGKVGSATPFADAAEMIKSVKELPNFKAVTIRGDIIENSGSSIVQELGFSIAAAHEYLVHLQEYDLTIDEIAKSMKFIFATGSNYFMEIAKIRVARLLWAQIVKQYEPKDNKSAIAHIHAITSDWNKTVYDPYVNMLRTQTEAMSSILGGVDSFTVKPFNTSYEKPTEFSERIARNQQHLLNEESHFDKVVDPAAGAYYIEHLTDAIAEQAWNIFLETEEKDGFIAALKSEFVQESVTTMAQKRDMDIAKRKENFLGINQFPNFNENLADEIAPSVFEEEEEIGETEFKPLRKYRGPKAFEAMRYKTDVYSKSNKRPLAFMLTIGNLTMRKARAQFACNFFAVAGFEVLDNNGFETIEEGIKAANEAKADIIVVCSSDPEYSTFAPEVVKQAGKMIPVVAGFPKATMDELKASGVEHFVHVKNNVLETLKEFQQMLGIV